MRGGRIMSENPFVFGNPVSGKHFSNREKEIKRITTRLKTMQSTSIVGERRMGKTSLLHYLSDQSEMEKRGFDRGEYIFLYFSFEGLTKMTQEQFWRRILRLLIRAYADSKLSDQMRKIWQGEEIDPFDIEDSFFAVKKQRLKTVLLLDEFDTVTQNENLEPDFFGLLRSLIISRDTELALVTTSGQEIAEMSPKDTLGSPFFNIFETVFLKPFDVNDALQLIDTALVTSGVFFEQTEIEFLTELSGRHPFFLQMGCYYLYDAYTIESLTGKARLTERRELVKKRCMEQAKPHFDYYWRKSTDSEKILLIIIAILNQSEFTSLDNLKTYYQESEFAVSSLEQRGLVLEKYGQYRIFSPMFATWIIREMINKRPSEGAYQAWLKNETPEFVSPFMTEVETRIIDYITPEYWGMIIEWLFRSENMEKILAHFDEVRRSISS
jgi:hypothetical protein